VAAFDQATAVHPRADGTTFDVALDQAWTIPGARPNGGYLLATVARAATAAATAAGAPQPHPIAVNVQFLRSPAVGPATVETEVLRTGRTASQVRARLVQDGSPCVEALVTLGTLHAGSEPWWGGAPPVALAPEEACLPMPPMLDVDGPSLRDSISVTFDPSVLGFMREEPSGEGELKAWFRFADGRDVDPLALLFVADALPPATFTIVNTGWVPTLDLTVYVRAVPAPGPLRMRFRARIIQDGLVDEICEIWDSADRQVALATQLAALRLPPPS
jgi:acyl-coenzyme A thioesterase PaaI-like protein